MASAPSARDPGRVEERPGGAAQVLAAGAQDEDEAGVAEAGGDAEDDALGRVVAVGAGLQRAGDEDDARRASAGASRGRGAPGFSFRTAHAMSGTNATWRLPRTVARPAPTSSIAWCQQTRSIAKKTPAIAASRRSRAGRGP